jgi:hypothetical protein
MEIIDMRSWKSGNIGYIVDYQQLKWQQGVLRCFQWNRSGLWESEFSGGKI